MSSLFIDRRGVALELESGAIVFRENGARIGTVPIAPLQRIFLRGDVQLSASLLGKLGEQGVGVVILSGRQGKPSLMLARPHNDAARRVAQLKMSLDDICCLEIARDLIKRKLKLQCQWFAEMADHDPHVRYELTHRGRVLEGMLAGVDKISSLASLRGLEGIAAARYFEGLRCVVPDSWGFKNRNRRPPRDPFNVLLSLTYTLLHAELAISLYGAGLDPYVGFYHQLEFARESLASDLMEPLRPRADRFALHLLRSKTLRVEDFSTTESGCLLGKAGRVRYYAAYEEHSETLRRAVNNEVEWIANCVGLIQEDSPVRPAGEFEALDAAEDDSGEEGGASAQQSDTAEDEA